MLQPASGQWRCPRLPSKGNAAGRRTRSVQAPCTAGSWIVGSEMPAETGKAGGEERQDQKKEAGDPGSLGER